jgi:hypothetical protein
MQKLYSLTVKIPAQALKRHPLSLDPKIRLQKPPCTQTKTYAIVLPANRSKPLQIHSIWHGRRLLTLATIHGWLLRSGEASAHAIIGNVCHDNTMVESRERIF